MKILHVNLTLLGHLDYFQFFLIMGNAAVKVLGHFGEDFCRIILRSGVFRAKGRNTFSCNRYY
jgi:hypothetical protein